MKSTKRSLLMSTLALILCFSMLLGTTYAWFTDSVTSGVNKIVAGNLDVELYHAASGAVTATDGNKVTESTLLFDNIEKWEPGVVAYENFMVKNVGNLALKYQLTMSVGAFNETIVGGYNLKQVLKAAVVPGGFSGNRADAHGLSYTTLANFSTNSNGALLPNTEGNVFGVVIYWEPGENDNNWNLSNGKKATVVDGKFGADELGIELGINLFATQLPSEEDSFDNQYDASADGSEKWNGSASAIAEVGKATIFTVNVAPAADQKTVVEFEDGALEEGSYKLDVETENNLFTATSENGEAATIDLKLYDKDGKLTETFEAGKSATITTYVTKGMEGVAVKYTGTDGKSQPTFKSYDPETGKFVFTTDHFSEYEVDFTSPVYIRDIDTAYSNLSTAMTAAPDNSVIRVIRDMTDVANATAQTKNVTVVIDAGITADLNGKNLCFYSENKGTIANSFKLVVSEGAKLKAAQVSVRGNLDIEGTGTIDVSSFVGVNANPPFGDLTIGAVTIHRTGGASETTGAVMAPESKTLTLNGTTVISDNSFAVFINKKNSTTVINGGLYTSASVTGQYKSTIYINNGAENANVTIDGNPTVSFTGSNGNAVRVGSGTLNIESGVFTAKGDNGTPVVYVDEASAKVYISGGDFSSETPNASFMLNKLDSVADSAVIEVTGGTFHGFNPADNAAEDEHTNYVKEGYYANEISTGVWEVSDQEFTVVKVEDGETAEHATTAAIAAAEPGAVIVLPKSETPIAISSISKPITIKGDGVTKVDASTAGTGVSAPGVVFENIPFYSGNATYNTIRGTVTYINCSFDGLVNTYDDSTYKGCTFTNSVPGNYLAHVYCGKATYTGCTFNGSNRCVYVYADQGGETKATFTECAFTMTEVDKSAIMLNSRNNGETYTVTINNCTQTGGNDQGTASKDGPKYDYRGLYGFKHSPTTVVGTVTVDGEVVYQYPAN